MAYITNADIEGRLGRVVYVQLTDDAGTGLPDEEKADAARTAAEGEVDSYLGRRYRVPVEIEAHPQAAGVLKGVALDLAEYRLYGRRGLVPADVKARRDAAVKWLERVADGRAVLPTALEVDAPSAGGIGAISRGGARVLTRSEVEDL